MHRAKGDSSVLASVLLFATMHSAFYSEILTKINFFGRGVLNAAFKEIETKANKNRPILL